MNQIRTIKYLRHRILKLIAESRIDEDSTYPIKYEDDLASYEIVSESQINVQPKVGTGTIIHNIKILPSSELEDEENRT